MPSLHELFERYGSLTTKQRGVLDYFKANPETVCYITLKELSASAGVSEVSILRLCRTLGFSGFSELKEQFRAELLEKRYNIPRLDLTPENAFPQLSPQRAEALHEILSQEAHDMCGLLSSISGDTLFRCANALLAANKVYIFGHDGCKILADYLAHRLNYFRINSVSIQMGNVDYVRGQLAKLKQGDFVVLFSFPEYHLPAHGIARFADHRNVPVLTITDSMQSPAVIENGYTFVCGTGSENFINSFACPASVINILTLCIAHEMGTKRIGEIEEAERRVNRFMHMDQQPPEPTPE